MRENLLLPSKNNHSASLRLLSSFGRMPKNLDGSSMEKLPIPTSSPRLLSILAAFLNKIHAQPR